MNRGQGSVKKFKGLIIAAAVLAVIGVGIWGIGKATAEYPEIGEAVSYAVNDADGIVMEMEEPKWSPFLGYSFRWKVSADSENTYTFNADGSGFEFLECFKDGQWHRLAYVQDEFPYNETTFTLGKEEGSALEGSLVQKYDDYGTRLEPGLYRLTLEMRENNADMRYLAQEFQIQ